MERCLPYGGSKTVTKEWQANLKWPFGDMSHEGFYEEKHYWWHFKDCF